LCQEKAQKTEALLWKIAREKDLTKTLEISTYPAYLTKLKGKFRYIILIKEKSNEENIHKILENLGKEYIIDIDPISVT
jgi:primosomal protein N'